MKLAQVLVNIIDNAIKYTSRGMIKCLIKMISSDYANINENESLEDSI
jgi:signal transduction histidine kinase